MTEVSEKYDWGERQERVDYLLGLLRQRDPDELLGSMSVETMIYMIELGTPIGKSVVATAGLIITAFENLESKEEDNR